MIALVTQEQAAAQLGCSVVTVARLRKQGKLRYIPGKGRGKTMIFAEDIDAYILETARWEEKLNLRASKWMTKERGTFTGLSPVEQNARLWEQQTSKRPR